jgi:hypothetical protein
MSQTPEQIAYEDGYIAGELKWAEAMDKQIDIEENLRTQLAASQTEVARLREALENPPRHQYWKAGEPDCPREIKAGNGELHTLRCKVCGQDNPRYQICRTSSTEDQP